MVRDPALSIHTLFSPLPFGAVLLQQVHRPITMYLQHTRPALSLPSLSFILVLVLVLHILASILRTHDSAGSLRRLQQLLRHQRMLHARDNVHYANG